MTNNYVVIEDNDGNMYLFIFDENENIAVGVENIERCEPGSLTPEIITLDEVKSWDGQLDNPKAGLDFFADHPVGYDIVADNDGIYPDCMGAAARIVYQIDDE